MKKSEAFFAGLIGFLIGKGVAPQDATSIVEGLRTYLGFEPPLGLTGYSLRDMEKGKRLKTCVVVRGKSYNAVALEDIVRHSTISVLGKKGAYLEVAPTIESLNRIVVIDELSLLKLIEKINEVTSVKVLEVLKIMESGVFSSNIIKNGSFGTGDFSFWRTEENVTISEDAYEGKYCAKLTYGLVGMPPAIEQVLAPFITTNFKLTFIHETTNTKTLRLTYYYTDGSSSNHDVEGNGAWKIETIAPDSAKNIQRIRFVGIETGMTSLLDAIYGVVST